MSRLSRSALAAVAVAAVLTGCARFRPEPLYIAFPEVPRIEYRLCDVDGEPAPLVCLSQRDGAALSKWLDKVRAFDHARQRLQRD